MLSGMYTMVPSFRVSNFVQRQRHLLQLQWKASLRVYANKHTSTLTHAKNDIFVSAHKEKEGLIMHKHNNFL